MKFFMSMFIVFILMILAQNTLLNKINDENYIEEIDRALEKNRDIKELNNFLTAEDEENDNDLFEADDGENDIEDEVDGHQDNFKLF